MLRRALLVSLCAVVAVSALQTITALAPSDSGLQAPPLANPGAAMPDVVTQGGLLVNVRPVRLVIPRIGLDASIESRGLDSQNNLDTAADFEHVAWYDRGPAPGQPGNALINGHVNWWTGDAVFTHLKSIGIGDEVRVYRSDGTALTFRVSGRQIVDASARVAWLFAPSRSATVTLITCAGVWDPLTFTNTKRLLVTATLA